MSNADLYILDVGHGNAAVIAADGVNIVIDAGAGTSLLEFLRQEGITHVDSVLVSHADGDHIGGLIGLIESNQVTIDKIRVNSDATKKSKLWEHLLFVLDNCSCKSTLDFNVALTRRDSGEFDSGSLSIEVLAPSLRLAGQGPGGITSANRRLRTNSLSVVIRVSYDTRPIAVLCGDLDDVGLDELLQSTDPRTAPVLVYPHHGGRSGAKSERDFAARLCATFQPETVVFSIGRGRHGTPIPEVVESVRSKVSRIRIACTQLSEHCAADLPAQHSSHLLSHFSKGRCTKASCAGTIRIDMTNETVSPSALSHLNFIQSNAPAALCLK